MAFTAKLLQKFGQMFNRNIPAVVFISHIYFNRSGSYDKDGCHAYILLNFAKIFFTRTSGLIAMKLGIKHQG